MEEGTTKATESLLENLNTVYKFKWLENDLAHLEQFDRSHTFTIVKEYPEDPLTSSFKHSGPEITCYSQKYTRENFIGDYTDFPSPKDLLKPLRNFCFTQQTRFWFYEICFNSHVTQYYPASKANREKVSNNLGIYAENNEIVPENVDQIPTFEYGKTHEVPYYSQFYENGTFCNLTGLPRSIELKFVCNDLSADTLLFMRELREISTCHYEFVVETSLLCKNRHYTSVGSKIRTISCLANPPEALSKLLAYDKERTPMHYDNWGRPSNLAHLFDKATDEGIVEEEMHERQGKGGDADSSTESIDSDDSDKEKYSLFSSLYYANSNKKREISKDYSCLQAKNEEWAFLFCLNMFVAQMFREVTRFSPSVILGEWHPDAHQAWVDSLPNSQRAQLAGPNHATLLYSSGDFCDASREKRRVVVRLECVNHHDRYSQYAQYMEKPTCVYYLTIKSPMACDYLEQVRNAAS
ncbi:endoplasmic reticulum lectin 1-like [Zophobas morio]|uniref:endoplasmic reticulum lectin 1-like n=1 Tax=Zophobas morio TaxID=2755281 RepID=UPI003083E53A